MPDTDDNRPARGPALPAEAERLRSEVATEMFALIRRMSPAALEQVFAFVHQLEDPGQVGASTKTDAQGLTLRLTVPGEKPRRRRR
jgi:hypothetical protein